MRILPPRAPDFLKQLATDFDVVDNFAFLAHRRAVPASAGLAGPKVNVGGLDYVVTNPLTLCNAYVSMFTAALGCPIPPMKANAQLVWLGSPEGQMAGWFSANRQLAVERAALGYPTVMVATEEPHGHIAMVIPGPATDAKIVYVSAAGASNFAVPVPSVKSFGVLLDAKALFFTHN